jgi:multimeric flavodoxin WrbA
MNLVIIRDNIYNNDNMEDILLKTLILNGSPRRDGDTAALIRELTNNVDDEVKMVNAYQDNIKACVDCRYCWHKVGCSIKDDMQEIYEYILECDNIVIASPLYFSELTGQLLAVLSRLQTYWSSKFIRKNYPIIKEKLGGVILVGGNGTKDKASDTAGIILKLLNAKVVSEVYSLKTDHVPSKDDEEALAEVRKMAIIFNDSYKN